MDENRLNHKIYQWSINLGNWAYRVKSMMDDVNIGNNFDQLPANINKAYIIKQTIEHIKSQENLTWLSEITRQESRRGNGRNKLRTYKLYKNSYVTETYTKIPLQRNQRSAYATFRMGWHHCVLKLEGMRD